MYKVEIVDSVKTYASCRAEGIRGRFFSLYCPFLTGYGSSIAVSIIFLDRD